MFEDTHKLRYCTALRVERSQMLALSVIRPNEMRRRIQHWRKFRKGKGQKLLLIFMYHRVSPDRSFDPFRTIVSPHTFEHQLELLKQEYTVCSLRDGVEGNADDDMVAALTFDDGYEDNYVFAYPILKKNGMSATFLVVTQSTTDQRPVWDWEVTCRICLANSEIQEIKIGSLAVRRDTGESRRSFALRLIEHLKKCSLPELEAALSQLKLQTRDQSVSDSKTMSWEQVKALNDNGMEIGSHSVSHRSLARIPFSEAVAEITRSKQEIEYHTQTPCLHFAFPFGTVRDHTPALIDAVKASGYQTCMLARPDLNIRSQNLFCLNRISVDESTDARYALG